MTRDPELTWAAVIPTGPNGPWLLCWDEHGPTRCGWRLLNDLDKRDLWFDEGEVTFAEAVGIRDALNRVAHDPR